MKISPMLLGAIAFSIGTMLIAANINDKEELTTRCVLPTSVDMEQDTSKKKLPVLKKKSQKKKPQRAVARKRQPLVIKTKTVETYIPPVVAPKIIIEEPIEKVDSIIEIQPKKRQFHPCDGCGMG